MSGLSSLNSYIGPSSSAVVSANSDPAASTVLSPGTLKSGVGSGAYISLRLSAIRCKEAVIASDCCSARAVCTLFWVCIFNSSNVFSSRTP